MLPPANPFVELNSKFGNRFGGLNSFTVEVSVEKGDMFTPERLVTLAKVVDDIYFLDTVRRDLVWAITLLKSKEIRGHSGEVYINAFMWPHPPDTIEECQSLKNRMLENDVVTGWLLSEDAKSTIITGSIKEGADEKEFFEGLLAVKKKFQGKEGFDIKMVGRPVLMGWIFHFMPAMLLIFALSLLVIIAVLSISFRNLLGLVVPILIGIMTTIWGLGFMGLIRMNLNPLMIVLPFAVGIRAVSHTVQITSRYMEEYARNGNKLEAAHTTVGAMFIPNISAIASDCAGFMFLVAIRITVVQQVAIAVTFWMIAIFFATAIFTPIFCMLLPKPSAKTVKTIKDSWANVSPADEGKGDVVDKAILFSTRFFLGQGRPVAIIGMAVIIVGGFYFGSQLKTGDLSPGSPILYPDSDYNVACNEINKKYSNIGTDVLQIYFDGGENRGVAISPPVLQVQERLHRLFFKEFSGSYAGMDSINQIAKTMNVEMHEGDPVYSYIPDQIPVLADLLSNYIKKTVGADMASYFEVWDYRYGCANYFFRDHMPDTVNAVIETTLDFFKNLDIKIPFGEFKVAGGEIGIDYAINHEIESVHFVIIFGVLFTIFILCTFSFRSFTAGFFLIIPLVASNAVAFSYMVFKGIGITVNTLPVISVGLGIGVDFGVYLYSRFQEEYKNFNDFDAAVLTGCVTAGKGVVYTALTMVVPLYMWYFISDLRFQGEMGLFLAIVLTVNLLAVMFFHPAIISRVKPKFITRMTME
jgi:predicted RND superfamily exporter protein